MIKQCMVCGKDFEPRYNLVNRQLCCSKECSKERERLYSAERYADPVRRENYLERQKELRKQKIKPRKCIICGEDVIPDGYFHRYNHTKMHDECVFNDCLETLGKGEHLDKTQVQRLAARGYTMKEFIQEYIPDYGKPKKADWNELKVGMICLN